MSKTAKLLLKESFRFFTSVLLKFCSIKMNWNKSSESATLDTEVLFKIKVKQYYTMAQLGKETAWELLIPQARV